jgi:hypothetical protein
MAKQQSSEPPKQNPNNMTEDDISKMVLKNPDNLEEKRKLLKQQREALDAELMMINKQEAQARRQVQIITDFDQLKWETLENGEIKSEVFDYKATYEIYNPDNDCTTLINGVQFSSMFGLERKERMAFEKKLRGSVKSFYRKDQPPLVAKFKEFRR